MRPPRFTIARLMVVVASAAIVMAVFRVWRDLIRVELLPFGITALMAGMGWNPSARRQALCVGAVGTLVLPFLAAAWSNHDQWGYYWSRPAVDRRIVQARQIETITSVRTGSDARGSDAFSGVPMPVDGYVDVPHYDDLEGRVIRAFRDHQLRPVESRKLPAQRLSSLYRILENTGRLDAGEPGYSDARKLSGIVVEAIGRDGRPLLFVGVRGRKISSNCYPYYEFLFTSDVAVSCFSWKWSNATPELSNTREEFL